jgi:hypothetical protein
MMLVSGFSGSNLLFMVSPYRLDMAGGILPEDQVNHAGQSLLGQSKYYKVEYGG